MLRVLLAFEQLSCAQLKFNPVITELDYCVSFSDAIDFYNRVFNVYNISAATRQTSRFTKKEYAATFAFHNSVVSNLIVNVDCQFPIEGNTVVVLDLGSNHFNNIRLFGQCTFAEKFNYMLQMPIMNADRSVWGNVSTGYTSNNADLRQVSFAFRGIYIPFLYHSQYSFADIVASANAVARYYTIARFYENETFYLEAQYIFQDNAIEACYYPYQATNGVCIRSNATRIAPRESEFIPYSYYMDYNEFFIFRSNNQSLYRCKDNYVFFYGICMPECPSGMLKQSGYCVWFCNEGFVQFAGMCLAYCPPWLVSNMGQCVQSNNDIKGIAQCAHYDGLPPIRSLRDADDFLRQHADLEKCRMFIYRHVVQTWDHGQICDPPFVWAYGNCKLECPDGLYRHVESNTCREKSRCTVIFERMCLDICPPGFVESGYWDCAKLYYTRLTAAYLFRDDMEGQNIRLNNSYSSKQCVGKLENSACVTTCSPGFYFLASNNSCVDACPENADIYTMSCVKQCETNYFKYMRKCYNECPSGTFYNNISLVCQENCKPLLQQGNSCVRQCYISFYNMSYYCVLDCPKNMYSNTVYRNCSTECQQGYLIVGDTFCISEEDFYADFFDDYVENCAPGFFDDLYAYYCVLECPAHLVHYNWFCTDRCFGKYRNGAFCVEKCAPPLISDVISMRCVTSCEPYRYYDYLHNSCALLCPNDTFATADGGCHARCPDPLFGEPRTRKCVQKCDVYGDPESHLCVHKCQPPRYGSNTTGRCERTCDGGGYADQLTRVCVRKCPDGFMTDKINHNCTATCARTLLQQGRECVRWCDSAYADYQNFVCVKTCRGIVFGGACFEHRPRVVAYRQYMHKPEMWNMVIAVALAVLLLIVCVV